ncbi:MAG: transcriptional repressor [Magnetovibrio sp.]|nr:transcriptional repressor [Magnetovibrio sp.]
MRPYTNVIEQLRTAGLRPTRQRLALAKLLFENGPRHVTAEIVRCEAQDQSIRVSLATVYNTLHHFTKAGLLREIVVDPARSYFDTTTTEHGHFFHEDTGVLVDMDSDVKISSMPPLPEGSKITSIDMIVRLRST